MPKHGEGDTAVLDPKSRTMSAREALALACELEDLANSLARLPGARKIVARLRALSEDLEDRADVEAVRKIRAEIKRKGLKFIPYEQVREELGL